MKILKLNFLSRLALPAILFIAFLNHLLTFLAYDWYDGIDGYSYNVAGLQLISGKIFDLYPIIFRPPLVPILKNLLYLIFDKHPYILFTFVHFIGIITVFLAYYLGKKFHKLVGVIIGFLFASSIQISVHFHHISTITFFIPILLLTAIFFIEWVRKKDKKSLVLLIITTSLCFLTRVEAIILIPIFTVFNSFINRNIKQSVVYFLSCIIVYTAICSIYFLNFGYWGLSNNVGWSLFERVYKAKDRQFASVNGPASMRIHNYMNQDLTSKVKEVDPYRFLGITFSLAQKELGYLAADKLFMNAAIESIKSDPSKFIKFTLLRAVGHLDLYYTPGLGHKEYLSGAFETDSGHMWGFEEKRMQGKRDYYYKWLPLMSKLESPITWEKKMLKARLKRLFGFKVKDPVFPESFKMSPIVEINSSGNLDWSYCGDSNMSERLWYCRDLDVFFYLKYLGLKPWSRTALKLLKKWDMFSPRGQIYINIHRIMWVFWILGILIIRKRWISLSLAAFLFFVIGYSFIQSIFSDNFGGRFELYTRGFLWLGFTCGYVYLFESWKDKVRKNNHNE